MLVSELHAAGRAGAGRRPRGGLRHHRAAVPRPRHRDAVGGADRRRLGRQGVSRTPAQRRRDGRADRDGRRRRRAGFAAAGHVRRRLRRRRQLGEGASAESGRRYRSTRPTSPELALARGAALACGQRPALEASTVGLAYSQDPDGTTAGSAYRRAGRCRDRSWPRSVAPTQLVDSRSGCRPGEPADEGRKPFLLVGSALTSIFVVGVVALVISLAVSIRPTADQRPSPGQSAIVPSTPGARLRRRCRRRSRRAAAGAAARRRRPSRRPCRSCRRPRRHRRRRARCTSSSPPPRRRRHPLPHRRPPRRPRRPPHPRRRAAAGLIPPTCRRWCSRRRSSCCRGDHRRRRRQPGTVAAEAAAAGTRGTAVAAGPQWPTAAAAAMCRRSRSNPSVVPAASSGRGCRSCRSRAPDTAVAAVRVARTPVTRTPVARVVTVARAATADRRYGPGQSAGRRRRPRRRLVVTCRWFAAQCRVAVSSSRPHIQAVCDAPCSARATSAPPMPPGWPNWGTRSSASTSTRARSPSWPPATSRSTSPACERC